MGCAGSTPPVLETRCETFYTKYKLGEEIGRGSFGKVCVCENRRSKTWNAVKIVDGSSEKLQGKAARELQVWKKVGVHENVVVLLDSYVSSSSKLHYFVMQVCCSTLSDKFTVRGDKFCYSEFLFAFHQVFLGLAHCHSRNIVHRDIKGPNVLVDAGGIVKIADFGLSLVMPKEGTVTGIVGSVPFMSPEMLQSKPYGFVTDVWSCGVLMYEMAYGLYPYDTAAPSKDMTTWERKRDIKKAIVNDKPRPAYELAYGMAHPPSHVRSSIERMLCRNSPSRPDASSCGKSILVAKASSQKDRDNTFRQSDLFDTGKESATGTWSPPHYIPSPREQAKQSADTLNTRCPTDTGDSSKLSSGNPEVCWERDSF